ncbi:glycosyl hydrolase family 18 protein [Paenibacillus lautus]|uniref:glycosyl hydrolase family 18 protein n=1 Tax=Paenibacillus lautus TaxID=1401 RepID=UPI002DB64B29|nr:glycosyl hydrolase family 18 protein [Paenibacillus lautus]MEC0255144.1 glycosyl hydrolase family 18 protein [Paenibacillus lautus]
MKNRRRKWAGAVVLMALCAAVSFWWLHTGEQEKALQAQLTQTEVKLSAWITDWQWKTGITDLKKLGGELEEIHFFAAYFNPKDELHLTSDFREGLPEFLENSRKGEQLRRVLTIVNDRFDTDGTADQKDPALISRIVATRESRSLHVGHILAVVSQHGFSGVELDYEKVRKEDWANLSALYEELYERLQAEGFSLRIVLEPGISQSSFDLLPEGPDYVLMAYNLYGGHSGPGPKADHAMIRKLADKLHGIPGDHAIALSVGGFDWAENGKVVSLTEKRAVELAHAISDDPRRDPSSGALYFEYTDDQGIGHTVWYADGMTIAGWVDAARDSGISKIAIWRLGDMEEDTLKQLKEYHQQSQHE